MNFNADEIMLGLMLGCKKQLLAVAETNFDHQAAGIGEYFGEIDRMTLQLKSSKG